MSPRDWAAPDRIAYLVAAGGRVPRITAVYRITSVSTRYVTAQRTSKPLNGRKDQFRISDGRVKGASEYAREILEPADSPLVAQARAARRIGMAAADLLALLDDSSTVARLSGVDLNAAIAMADEIIAAATAARTKLIEEQQ